MNKLSILFIVIISFVLQCINAYAFSSTWHAANNGLNIPGKVTALALHPTNNQELYAGTFFGGLYKSTDAAQSWTAIANNLFEGTFIFNIVFNPKNSNEMFVTSEQKGILKSIDGGIHWQELNPELKKLNLHDLEINPQNPNEMFITSFFRGIYKTTDGGTNWKELTNGLEKVEFTGKVYINSSQPNLLLLQAWEGFQAKLFKSIDGGLHWTLLPSAKFYVLDIAFAPDNPQTIYVSGDSSFYKSTDGGNTWTVLFQSNKTPSHVNAFVIDQNNPQSIYIKVSDDGIYKTVDAGKNWQKISGNVDEKEFPDLIMNPSNANDLYLTSDTVGVLHTIDGGLNWQTKNTGIFNASILSLASPSEQPNTQYAGTVGNGLWIMHDGKTWQRGDAQFAHYTIKQIVIDPLNSENLVMLVEKDPKAMYTDIYFSHDAGQHWQAAEINKSDSEKFIPITLTYNPKNSREIFAGDYRSNIWKSTDSGATWTPWSEVNEGFNYINTISINPKNTNEMYAGTESFKGRLAYKSSDGGKSWAQLKFNFDTTGNHFLKHLYAMAIDPAHSNILYASARVGIEKSDLHFYKSMDNGLHWQIIGKNLPSIEVINTILIDPNNPNTIYVTTGYYFDSANFPEGDGIYVSHDSGETFMPINDGLNNLITTSLTLNHGKLFTGTEGSGVYST